MKLCTLLFSSQLHSGLHKQKAFVVEHFLLIAFHSIFCLTLSYSKIIIHFPACVPDYKEFYLQ